MNPFMEGIVSIALAIVGLGVVATIVSKRADTSNIVGAGFQGLGSAISAAQGPVMGDNFTLPQLGGGFGH